MASSSGAFPAATSFCIELRKPLGSPSSAVRIGSGETYGPLGRPDGTGLIKALLQACPPARVRPDTPERALRRRGRQRKRRQKAELAPEHGGLVVLHFAAHPGVTQFFAQGLGSLLRCRIRCDLHIGKRRVVPNSPRTRLLSFDPYRPR